MLVSLSLHSLYIFVLALGAQVLDRENQMDNPCPFLSEQAWDNITELEKLANFHGIIQSFEQYPRDWNVWFTSAEPETTSLPGGRCLCYYTLCSKKIGTNSNAYISYMVYHVYMKFCCYERTICKNVCSKFHAIW